MWHHFKPVTLDLLFWGEWWKNESLNFSPHETFLRTSDKGIYVPSDYDTHRSVFPKDEFCFFFRRR